MRLLLDTNALLLVPQASSEKMTLVTADATIARYEVKCLW
jgi:PIN domain nuclease of toxin-antitoxin system